MVMVQKHVWLHLVCQVQMLPASFHLPARMWIWGLPHGLVLQHMGLVQKKKKGGEKILSELGHERQEWAGTKCGWRGRGGDQAVSGRRRLDGMAEERASEVGRETQERQMIFAAAIGADVCQGRFHLSGAGGRMLWRDVRWCEVQLWGWKGEAVSPLRYEGRVWKTSA